MTAFPETNDASDSGTNNNDENKTEEQHPSVAEAAEPSSELPALLSGKRDQTSIMGGFQSAKREKREWLSFRGAKHTRVGEEYQVAFLPPVGSSTTAATETSKTSDETGN